MSKAEQILQKIVDMAREHPGQPVAVVAYPDGEMVGVMSVYPDQDDWFYYPIRLEDVVEADDCDNESIA